MKTEKPHFSQTKNSNYLDGSKVGEKLSKTKGGRGVRVVKNNVCNLFTFFLEFPNGKCQTVSGTENKSKTIYRVRAILEIVSRRFILRPFQDKYVVDNCKYLIDEGWEMGL